MAALGVALLDMPYGYYMLVRLLICGVCAYLASRDADSGRTGWVWVLGGCAVVYNPIFKFPLSREIWTIVNVATIALLAVHMLQTSRHRTAELRIQDRSTPSQNA
jgi:low affinity Fe/Cu permease